MIFVVIILLIFSLLLETIIPNLLRGIIPFFMVAAILVSSILRIDTKKFYITVFIIGVLYDFFYTNTIILNGFMFFFIAYLSKLIINEDIVFFRTLFFYVLLSLSYVLILFLLTYIYVPQSIIDILIKLKNSAIINFAYFTIIYLLSFLLRHFICNRNKKRSYF